MTEKITALESEYAQLGVQLQSASSQLALLVSNREAKCLKETYAYDYLYAYSGHFDTKLSGWGEPESRRDRLEELIARRNELLRQLEDIEREIKDVPTVKRRPSVARGRKILARATPPDRAILPFLPPPRYPAPAQKRRDKEKVFFREEYYYPEEFDYYPEDFY